MLRPVCERPGPRTDVGSAGCSRPVGTGAGFRGGVWRSVLVVLGEGML